MRMASRHIPKSINSTNKPLQKPLQQPARKISGQRKPKKYHKYGRCKIIDIYYTIPKTHKKKQYSFKGACLDIGSQQSCIGKYQAKAYCRQQNLKFKLTPSNIIFRFGNTYFKSMGTLPIRIPTPDYSFIHLEVDVINADIPFLLGIDVLDNQQMYADNTENKLVSKRYGWTLPIIRRNRHLYITWPIRKIYYTRAELYKLHHHFYHPSASKLYNLLRRTNPSKLNPNTIRTLDEITKSCSTCQKYSKGPHRFRVSFPKEKCIFNHEIAIDLLWLNGNPALHVVDTHTHFSAAAFIKSKSSSCVWNTFIQCWAATYIGYPDIIRLDQESAFMSKEFKSLTNSAGIELKISGVESHNAIGPGERYHAPLRHIFLKILEDYPNLNQEIALQLSVKSMNDTMGPEGLVPSLLVFGQLPRFPPHSTPLLSHSERMNAMTIARKEMANITARLRIQKALKSKLPPATKYLINPGDQVYVYSEKSKHWNGPFPVTRTFEKSVWVKRPDKEAQYSIDHTIPIQNAPHSAFINHLSSSFKDFTNEQHPIRVYLTEVLKPGDHRATHPKFDEARQKEIHGLIERGVFKLILKEEVPPKANILGTRMILAIKNKNTDQELFKARLVVQGHRDKDKHKLVHPTTTLRHSSIRMLTTIAAMFGFRLWSQDVTQAYLQSASNLMRDIYVKPSKEFCLDQKYMLKLLKPLYGLSDAGDYWDSTITQHLQQDLQMSRTALDICLFFKHINGKLAGLSGYYVDDNISTGTEKFEKLTRETEKRFDSKPRTYNSFKFAGIEIETTPNGTILLHQKSYIPRIKPLPEDATFYDYRSMRQRLMWLTHTRPDITCGVNKSTQVTKESFSQSSIILLNTIIRQVHKYPTRGILQQKLNPDSLILRIYTDGSFADNDDQTTQLGYLVLLCDNSSRCNILHYSSSKSGRVVRSTLGGETLAFANGLDFGLAVKHDLDNILNKNIPVRLFTDCKSLFDVITKNTVTTEKRLMVDIQAIREAYAKFDIHDVAWIKSEYNPADSLTKIKENQVLNRIMDEGIIEHPVSQWIIRSV